MFNKMVFRYQALIVALIINSMPLNVLASPTLPINDVSMTRMAIQPFYIPRLAEHAGSLVRVPMNTAHTVSVYADSEVQVFPIASWQDEDLYVTALILQNTSAHKIILDPRRFLGDWQSAAFFRKDHMVQLTMPVLPYNVLMPHGEMHDQTMAFLVSSKPFALALQGSKAFVQEVPV